MKRDQFKKAYTQQRSNAKRRGIEMRMTFDEWKAVWLDSGRWNKRGRGADKYCMCRIGDVGHYEVGNVFIAKNKRNVSDGNIGKLDSEETKRKKSIALIGTKHPWSAGKNNPMHRPDVKAKISAAISGDKHYRQKGVITPEGIFETTKSAAAALGMKKSTVEWRCKNNKLGFSYAIA